MCGLRPSCTTNPSGQRGVDTSSPLSHCALLCLPQALKWHLSPLTIVSWLNVYLQVAYLNDVYEVLLPQYPQQIFIQIAEASSHALVGPAGPGCSAPGVGGGGPRLQLLFFPQLLDLCVLDVGCLEFPYGVLAASALYHFSSSELMQKVSGTFAFGALTLQPIAGLRSS